MKYKDRIAMRNSVRKPPERFEDQIGEMERCCATPTSAPAPEQPVKGCWYYDHNVCGLPHPSPTAEQHDAQVAKAERERILKVIADGKAALYEIEPDGHWGAILQAKMDVLCWMEETFRESLRAQPEPQQEGRQR
jgi:hypothetical protein